MVEEEKRLRVDNDPIGKAIETLPRARLHQAPLQLDGDRHHRGSREGHARRLPEVLRHLLPAQQRDADRGRRRRRGDGAQAGRPVLRRRSRAAPEPPRDYADGAAADRDARARRCRSRCRSRSSSAATTSRAPPIPTCRALEVLAAILSAGESSRLHQRLVRQDHLAIAAGGVTESMEDPGPVHRLRGATCPTGSAPRSRRRWPRRSRACATSRSTADELEKAKNQLAAAFVFGLQTVDGIATRLGAGAVRRGGLAPLHRGGDALPGGHRRRRAAGGAQVPRRHQPHARDAGPPGRETP